METNSFEIEFNGIMKLDIFLNDETEAERIFNEWAKEQDISAEITNITPLLPDDVRLDDYYIAKINSLLDKIKLDDDSNETLAKICELLENGVN